MTTTRVIQITTSRGLPGASAYEEAVEKGLFTGTLEEFLESLKGSDGDNGLSAYQIAVNNGFVGTEQEWLNSLKGSDGDNGNDGNPGTDGIDGLSAYQIAVNLGFNGTIEEWRDSLEGTDGAPGKSAYELALEQGFEGSLSDWILSLKGSNGNDGRSAYQIAVNNGFVGTEQEWLNSLKGKDGSGTGSGASGVQYEKWNVQNNVVTTSIEFKSTITQESFGSSGTLAVVGDITDKVATITGATSSSGVVKFRSPDVTKSFVLALSGSPILDASSINSSTSIVGLIIATKINETDYALQIQTSNSGAQLTSTDENGYLTLSISNSTLTCAGFNAPFSTDLIYLSLFTASAFIPAPSSVEFDLSGISSSVQGPAILPSDYAKGSIYEIQGTGFYDNYKFRNSDIVVISNTTPIEFSFIKSSTKVHQAVNALDVINVEENLVPATVGSTYSSYVLGGSVSYDSQYQVSYRVLKSKEFVDFQFQVSDHSISNGSGSLVLQLTETIVESSDYPALSTNNYYGATLTNFMFSPIEGDIHEVSSGSLPQSVYINQSTLIKTVDINSTYFQVVFVGCSLSGDFSDIQDVFSTNIIKTSKMFLTLGQVCVSNETVKFSGYYTTPSSSVKSSVVRDFDYIDISNHWYSGKVYSNNSYVIPYDNLTKAVIIDGTSEALPEKYLGILQNSYPSTDNLVGGESFFYTDDTSVIYYVYDKKTASWTTSNSAVDAKSILWKNDSIISPWESEDVIDQDDINKAITKLNNRPRAGTKEYGTLPFKFHAIKQISGLVGDYIGSTGSSELGLRVKQGVVESGSINLYPTQLYLEGDFYGLIDARSLSSVQLSLDYTLLPQGLIELGLGNQYDYNNSDDSEAFVGLLFENNEGSGYVNVHAISKYSGTTLTDRIITQLQVTHSLTVTIKILDPVTISIGLNALEPFIVTITNGNVTSLSHLRFKFISNSSGSNVTLRKVVAYRDAVSVRDVQSTTTSTISDNTKVPTVRIAGEIARSNFTTREAMQPITKMESIKTFPEEYQYFALPYPVTQTTIGISLLIDKYEKFPLYYAGTYKFPVGPLLISTPPLNSSGANVKDIETSITLNNLDTSQDGVVAQFSLVTPNGQWSEGDYSVNELVIFVESSSTYYKVINRRNNQSVEAGLIIVPPTLLQSMQFSLRFKQSSTDIVMMFNNLEVTRFTQRLSSFEDTVYNTSILGWLKYNISNKVEVWINDARLTYEGNPRILDSTSAIGTNYQTTPTSVKYVPTLKVVRDEIKSSKFTYRDKLKWRTPTITNTATVASVTDTSTRHNLNLSDIPTTLKRFTVTIPDPVTATSTCTIAFAHSDNGAEGFPFKIVTVRDPQTNDKIGMDFIRYENYSTVTTRVNDPLLFTAVIEIIQVNSNNTVIKVNDNHFHFGRGIISNYLQVFGTGDQKFTLSEVECEYTPSTNLKIARNSYSSDDDIVSVKLLKTLGIIS